MTRDELTQLRGSLGKGRVIEDLELLISYGAAMRGPSGQAAFVVEPQDVAEVSTVASWAYEHRQRLVVQGANTGLVGASTPDDTGLQGVVSLRRLDRILTLSTEARTVDIEAGVTLEALNDFLSADGLMFPLGIGSNPTVGGMIATNAGGVHTLRHGNAGDRVVELEAVLADENGTVIGNLERPKKDNSRLRAAQMLVGSYGSLGVVVRARLSLVEKPRSRATALLALDRYESVISCLEHLKASVGDVLSAFEVISGEALQAALDRNPDMPQPFRSEEYACYVLVEASSGQSGLDLEESLAATLTDLAPQIPGGLLNAVVAPPEDLWRLRHSLSEATTASGTTLRFDISMRPSELPAFRSRLDRELKDSDSLTISEFGHWADGGTHLQLRFGRVLSVEEEEESRRFVYDLVVREFSGSFSAEHGLGPFNAPFYARYVAEPERALGRRIKDAFDPRGVWGVAPFAAN